MFEEFYTAQNAPFVRVLNSPEEVAILNVVRSNYCDISAMIVERSNQLVIASTLDNRESAAGQALQNMNIMCRLIETAGLKGQFVAFSNGSAAMDFNLSESEQAVLDTAREFAQNKVRPIARELDQTSRFPSELVREMGELGLMGVYVPDQYGGAACSALAYNLAVLEISKACASTGVILSAPSCASIRF
jgi:hypothetical protein